MIVSPLNKGVVAPGFRPAAQDGVNCLSRTLHLYSRRIETRQKLTPKLSRLCSGTTNCQTLVQSTTGHTLNCVSGPRRPTGRSHFSVSGLLRAKSTKSAAPTPSRKAKVPISKLPPMNRAPGNRIQSPPSPVHPSARTSAPTRSMRKPQISPGPGATRTPEYKAAARKWTMSLIALPVFLVTSYYLFDRRKFNGPSTTPLEALFSHSPVILGTPQRSVPSTDGEPNTPSPTNRAV